MLDTKLCTLREKLLSLSKVCARKADLLVAGGKDERQPLDQRNHDIDVAAYCLGIRARLVCDVHQRLSDLAFHARQADVETSLEEVAAIGQAEVHFRVNG